MRGVALTCSEPHPLLYCITPGYGWRSVGPSLWRVQTQLELHPVQHPQQFRGLQGGAPWFRYGVAILRMGVRCYDLMWYGDENGYQDGIAVIAGCELR